MAIPHSQVRVVSSFGNIRGVYTLLHEPLPEVVEGPAYESRRTKGKAKQSTFLYRQGGRWILGPSVGGEGQVCSAGSSLGADSTKIPKQPAESPWSKHIIRVEVCTVSGAARDLHRLEMHSKHPNLTTGLRRQGDHRCWSSDAKDVWLWFCTEVETWKVTKGEPGSAEARKVFAIASANVDHNDPRKAAWASTNGAVDGVCEVWWPEKPEERFDFWRDPQFPPSDTSLGAELSKNRDVEWILARDLDRDPSHEVLFSGIDPSDLQQGSLGDCWLIAAIAAVAEYPSAIEALFPKGQEALPVDGKHSVHLFDIVKNDWITIEVDEYIPCKRRQWYELHASPLFSRPHGNEMWVLILEKAFAKLYGSYEMLQGGRAAFAWQALTGCVAQRIILKASKSQWDEYELDMDELIQQRKQGVPHDFPLQRGDDFPRFTEDQLWKELINCQAKENVMAAAVDRSSESVQKDLVLDAGLVTDHAYSVIQIQAVGIKHFIELRNPVGSGADWKGRWGENDQMWEKHPEVKAQLHKESTSDGTFWMDFDDFFHHFDAVSVCPCKASQTLNRLKTPHSNGCEPGKMAGSSLDSAKKREKQVRFSEQIPAPWTPETYDCDSADRCSQRCTHGCSVQ